MKKLKVLLISSLLLLAIQNFAEAQVQAQERKHALSLTGGYVTRVFNTDFDGNASGAFLGLNLYKCNATGLTTDAQFSLNFISEENRGSSNILSVGILYGIRVYFNSPEAKTRVFFNTLLGPALKSEMGGDFTELLIDVGYSAGFYAAPGDWVFGVGIDNPGLLTLKVGYTF